MPLAAAMNAPLSNGALYRGVLLSALVERGSFERGGRKVASFVFVVAG